MLNISVTVLGCQIFLVALFPGLFIENKELVNSYIVAVRSLWEYSEEDRGFTKTNEPIPFEDSLGKLLDFADPAIEVYLSFGSKIGVNTYYAVTAFFYLLLIYVHISKFLKNSRVGLFFGRMSTLFKQNILVNFSFILTNEVIILFLFFFLTLYFLEFHCFFIYTYGGSTDSFIYQFNFLITSFFFIFLVKLAKSLHYDNIFFLITIFLNSNLEFHIKKKIEKSNLEATSGNYSTFQKTTLAYTFKYSLKFFFTIFFFCSTFIVWLLRFCIQFIRLLVLFLIHAVFELIIVSSDSYLAEPNQSNIFFFKSIFFFFFYFCSFFYLLVYLNLMFTLQTFIFFFFFWSFSV